MLVKRGLSHKNRLFKVFVGDFFVAFTPMSEPQRYDLLEVGR